MEYNMESKDDKKCSMNYCQTRKNAEYRDWLYELREKSLSLDGEERQIAEDVFVEAERQAQERGLPTCSDEDEIFQKMIIVKENLKTIIEQFQMCEKAKQEFLHEYPRWQTARSQSIDSLQSIGNSIHLHRLNSNISRLVGNCTSFVGGGLLITSAILIPFTFGLSAPFAIAGGVTTALGSATSIGTSVTEGILLKNKVEQAKEIVEKDKLSFKALENWLIRSNTVSEALNAILSIDVDNTFIKILEIFKKNSNLAVNTCNSIQKNTFITDLVNFALENLSPKFLMLNISPRLIGLLMVLAIQCNTNQTIFNDACKTSDTLTNRIFSITNASVGLLQPAVSAIIRSAQNVVGVALSRGLIAGIGMSLDIASVVLTSIDVHNGSNSEEGQKIIEAANKLKEEADTLHIVYNELA